MTMDTKPQHENLILQIILNAIKDEGADYLDTDDGRDWLMLLDISRYINEHLDD